MSEKGNSQIIMLTITGANGSKREMRCVQDSYNRIEIWNERFSTIDLSPLQSNESLETLHFTDTGMEHIDLSPLSSCSNLKQLSVGGRSYMSSMHRIDISPLSSCSKLEYLYLGCNRLHTIDLNPLSFCTGLKGLSVRRNELQNIDLTPLSSCESLRTIDVSLNKLQSIDLTPLSSCADLQSISLDYNWFQSLDLSPLASCCCSSVSLQATSSIDITPILLHPSLKNLDYNFRTVKPPSGNYDYPDVALTSLIEDPFQKRELRFANDITDEQPYVVISPAPEGSWEFLHRISTIPQAFSVSAQSYVLNALGFQAFGLIDKDISQFLQSIPPQTSFDEAKEIVKPFLIETVCEQIDKGGTTILLDVNAMMNVGEIAYKMESILELRDTEMKEIKIERWMRDGWRGYVYHIKPLILTAYGFAILMKVTGIIYDSLDDLGVMDKGTYPYYAGFERIEEAIKELGYVIEYIERPIEEGKPYHERYVPKNMSKQMMNYVLALAGRMDEANVFYLKSLIDEVLKTYKAPQLRNLLQKYSLSPKGRKYDMALRLLGEKGVEGVRKILDEEKK